MARFQDWRFRNKLLLVTLLPLGVVTLLLVVAFYLGLQRVWEDVLPLRANLLQLDASIREYQGEIREFVLLRESETLDEIDATEEDLQDLLGALKSRQSTSDEAARMVSFEAQIEDLIRQGRDLVSFTQTLPVGVAGLPGDDTQPTLLEDLERFEDREQTLEDDISAAFQDAEARLSAAVSQFNGLILMVAAIGCGIGLALALGLARWMERPIALLREASGRILDGEFRIGERINSRDEMGQLAAGYDQAAATIRGLLADKEEHLDTMRDNQAQMLRSGRLAAVGELAAGVAHEINNPLSVVLTYSVLLREKAVKASPEALQSIPKLTERLQLVETAARRCKDIADNLLTFSRQDEVSIQPVDLASVIEDSLDLIRPLLRRRNIQLEQRVDDGMAPVSSNTSQLQQVVFNLMTNAIHAMPDGGSLRLSAQAAEGGCTLEIADEGTGIEPAVIHRIFEPFFTTKPPGQGTGLGLSIVYGIVESQGGTIDVTSEVGKGTSLIIWLPSAGT